MAEATSPLEATGLNEETILGDLLCHSNTVRKLIECPVCFELPLPPIYLCLNGHIVCNRCRTQTNSCPLCRGRYTSARGFLAEGLVENSLLPCKYVEDGCLLSMRGDMLVKHVAVCDYRPVKCTECDGKLVGFGEYEDHLLKYHRITGIHESKLYMICSMNWAHQNRFVNRCNLPQFYLRAHGVTFLLRFYATQLFVCAWISYLGPKSDCTKFHATLEFHIAKDDYFIVQGPVNHFRDDVDKDIVFSGKGVIIPNVTLLNLAPIKKDTECFYIVKIRKHVKSCLSETRAEAKDDITGAGSVKGNNEDSSNCKAGGENALTLSNNTVTAVLNVLVSGNGSLRSPILYFSTYSPFCRGGTLSVNNTGSNADEGTSTTTLQSASRRQNTIPGPPLPPEIAVFFSGIDTLFPSQVTVSTVQVQSNRRLGSLHSYVNGSTGELHRTRYEIDNDAAGSSENVEN